MSSVNAQQLDVRVRPAVKAIVLAGGRFFRVLVCSIPAMVLSRFLAIGAGRRSPQAETVAVGL